MAHALVIDPAAVARAAARQPSDAAGLVQTVTGPIAAARLGLTLMHEHVLVDFIGAGPGQPAALRRRRRVHARAAATCARRRRTAARRSSSARPRISGAIRGCWSGCPRRPACTSSRTPATTARTRTSICRRTRSPRAPSSSRRAGFASASRASTAPSIKPAFMKIGVDAGAAVGGAMRSWCAPRPSRTRRPGCRSPPTPATALPPSRSSTCWSGPACRCQRSSGCTRRASGTARCTQRAAARGAWVEFDGISPRERRPATSNWCLQMRAAGPPRSRAGVARRRLVSRRRAGRRPVPSVRHAVHEVHARAEGGGHDEHRGRPGCWWTIRRPGADRRHSC